VPTSDDNKRAHPPNSREQRLAEQLRVNLKRRKAAERAKAAPAIADHRCEAEVTDQPKSGELP
jgi:hypothetical protein